MNIQAIKARYQEELVNYIMPFWHEHAVDRERGGFYSMLDRTGEVYCTDKYMWMQWRCVYMFSVMYNSRFSRREWRQAAEHGFEFLRKYGRKPDGSYYYAMKEDGSLLQDELPGISIFSDSFAAIGAAELFRATGRPECADEARSACRVFLENIRKSEQGPWLRLGHYMILLNVAFVLNHCLKTKEYDGVITDMIAKIRQFFNPELNYYLELKKTSGSFDLDTPDGRIVNPGHALEAMWFMMQAAEERRDNALIGEVAAQTELVLNYGWDWEHGGIRYFLDAQGKPLVDAKNYLKSWWCQCEAAVAALYAYKLTRNPVFADWFERIDAWIWRHVRDNEFPEWFAITTPDGTPLVTAKGSPFKTCFHVPRMLFTCHNLLESLE